MNYLKERPHISDYLDGNGIKEGDLVSVDPLTGRKFSFPLLRTSYDLISSDLKSDLTTRWTKELGSQEYESFHVQIYQERSFGRQNKLKERYRVKVLRGAPIKLNGNFILDAFLEHDDCLEVGYNSLKLSRKQTSHDTGKQDTFLELNQKVVKSKIPILLEGDTGVGKSSLARKIHQSSYQRGRFVSINIASFAESLIESELFGHVKGAFTGALKEKEGAFREANRGTLFIDEIDSLPMDIQTKLLLFLDDFRGRPVGGSSEYQVDLRIIFSSGSKLMTLVKQGRMRKDFFYRVSSGQTFKLSSLRDQPELITDFCQQFSLQQDIKISAKLLDFYESLPWPGNYRQIKGHLLRKQVLSRGNRFDFDEVDESLIEQSSELFEISQHHSEFSLEEIKEAYITKIYYQCEKNYTAAAQKLQISTRSIRKVIQKGEMSKAIKSQPCTID